MNVKALLNTLSSRAGTLPIIIFYVTEGCNLRCVTCSYRNPLPNELTLPEIEELAAHLKSFGLKHIVYSGGEPLLRRDFPDICEIFRKHRVKQTLLTNGLLLEKRLDEIQSYFTEIIVSLDGPSAEVHDSIRGLTSFHQILKGVRKTVLLQDGPIVSLRSVVQRQNFRYLSEMVDLAASLRVARISFLPADILSDSFGRDTRGNASSSETITLTVDETSEFRLSVERLIASHRGSFETGFISESPGKMRGIVQYFEALIGKSPFPFHPCNAPMVSSVITSTGNILPCFFLPSYGNLHEGAFEAMVNNSSIQSTRKAVRAYSLDRCHTCVCRLHVKPHNALLNRF